MNYKIFLSRFQLKRMLMTFGCENRRVKSPYLLHSNLSTNFVSDLHMERVFLPKSWSLLGGCYKIGFLLGMHYCIRVLSLECLECLVFFIFRTGMQFSFFFSCHFSYQIWAAIYSWLTVSAVLHNESVNHVVQHGFFLEGNIFVKLYILFG